MTWARQENSILQIMKSGGENVHLTRPYGNTNQSITITKKKIYIHTHLYVYMCMYIYAHTHTHPNDDSFMEQTYSRKSI